MQNDSEFKQYQRKGLSEMRPYVLNEDLSKVSVSPEDNPSTDMGMIARNPKNHNDQWYVARKYFDDHLEPVLEAKEGKFEQLEDCKNLLFAATTLLSKIKIGFAHPEKQEECFPGYEEAYADYQIKRAEYEKKYGL